MTLRELIRRLENIANSVPGRGNCEVEIDENKFIIYERTPIEELDVNRK